VNDLSLRPATTGDVPVLTELVNAAYGHYVERIGGPPQPMREDYAEVVRSRQVTVAERDGQVVGLIVLDAADDELVIENVAVRPAHQGTGVGRALLEYAEDVARGRGFNSVRLYTHERMVENLALYKRIGYIEFERRRHGPRLVVHLRKKLA
jgi:ribosomal protein S18 acetylase RimI-like enzyme